MNERLATLAQVARIRLLQSHPARIASGKVIQEVPDGQTKTTRAALEKMAERQWIELPEGDGEVVVTQWGDHAATDREDLETYQNLSSKVRSIITVTPRPLGHAPIAGWGCRRVGRNVTCRQCRAQEKGEAEADAKAKGESRPRRVRSEVWFTNESGAQREAETVAGAHYRKHQDGTLPPLEVNQ